MRVSHDTGARSKIASVYLIGAIVTAGVTTAMLHGHIHSSLILMICLCMVPVFILCCKKRIESLATHVFIQQDSLACTIGGQKLRIERKSIAEIEDTGYTQAPHLIIVSLHDGREIEFFPSRDFGGFGSLALKKRLKRWLVSSEF